MSVRLSPAGSLLRNSKLFALPTPIALPPAPPSSGQIANSNTATTIYPIYAAIASPRAALKHNDWGFKRPLPPKAASRTNHPIVRLVRGIDTSEHIADFESAADHALNLRKFNEMHQPLIHNSSNQARGRDVGVFRASHDYTTDVPATPPVHAPVTGVWPSIPLAELTEQLPEGVRRTQQKYEDQKAEEDAALRDPANAGANQLMQTTRTPKRAPRAQEIRRWRYDGPSLVQMSGMDFDAYLEGIGDKQRAQLTERVQQRIRSERAMQSRDRGTTVADADAPEVSEREVQDYLRRLRNEPRQFGPIITELLDLPEGTFAPARSARDPEVWEYGRSTLAAEAWQSTGPPRTHPSAGLSYVHTRSIANNHPTYGAQQDQNPVTARAVRHRIRVAGQDATYGVAGFIVPKPTDYSSDTRALRDSHRPQPGGNKIPVLPSSSYVDERGSLILQTRKHSEYRLMEDKPIHLQEAKEIEIKQFLEQQQAAAAAKAEDGEPSAPQMSSAAQPFGTEAATELRQAGGSAQRQNQDRLAPRRGGPRPQAKQEDDLDAALRTRRR